MKMFCVSYMSYFDNEVKQTIVFTENTLSAMKKVVSKEGYEFNYVNGEAEFKDRMFDADVAINAIEVVIT